MTETSHLKALQETAERNKTLYSYDSPNKSVLETFDSPGGKIATTKVPYLSRQMVRIEVPEFTSLCPKTGQPDFATITIDYIPDNLCVESKSLKIYLMGFRNHGEFHEACVARITSDLVDVMNPIYLRVTGHFTPRGGIPFKPCSVYVRQGEAKTVAEIFAARPTWI